MKQGLSKRIRPRDTIVDVDDEPFAQKVCENCIQNVLKALQGSFNANVG